MLAQTLGNGQVTFPSLDGNGNVSAYVSPATATISELYQYSPFGEDLRGRFVILPFGFSSQYTDPETDLIYYGYRYYKPSTGRWLTSDPLGEQGGLNLYAFVANDPEDESDFLGLADTEMHHFIPEWLAAYTSYGARNQGLCIRLTQQFHRGTGGLETQLAQIRTLLRSGAINQFQAYNRVLWTQIRNLPAIIRNNRQAVGISGGEALVFRGAIRAALAQAGYFTWADAVLGATGIGTVAAGGVYLTDQALELGAYNNYNLQAQSEIDLYNSQVAIASRASQLDAATILSLTKPMFVCPNDQGSPCAKKFRAELNRSYFFIQTVGSDQLGFSINQARDAVSEQLFLDYFECLQASGCCILCQ